MRRLIDSIRARFHGLRCRPGDVCWVVRDVTTEVVYGTQTLLRGGTVVRVVSLDSLRRWTLEGSIEARVRHPLYGLIVLTIKGISDDLLIPLRDRPGEDETLRAEPKRRPSAKPAQQPEKVEG